MKIMRYFDMCWNKNLSVHNIQCSKSKIKVKKLYITRNVLAFLSIEIEFRLRCSV